MVARHLCSSNRVNVSSNLRHYNRSHKIDESGFLEHISIAINAIQQGRDRDGTNKSQSPCLLSRQLPC
jgi:hypothetical protein